VSEPSLGNCPFCGYGPIQSGLFICRGCHAHISYVHGAIKLLVGLIVVPVALVAAFVLLAIVGRAFDWPWAVGLVTPVWLVLAYYSWKLVVDRIGQWNAARGRAKFGRHYRG
jgi:membrane protein implicated in regulation of membrane protease activity